MDFCQEHFQARAEVMASEEDWAEASEEDWVEALEEAVVPAV